MKLTCLKHAMLKRFCGGSKNLRAFTSGAMHHMQADVAQRHLDELQAAGYITPIKGDGYRMTQTGLKALDSYGKASAAKAEHRMRLGDYVPPMWNVRDGTEAFLLIPSLRFAA